LLLLLLFSKSISCFSLHLSQTTCHASFQEKLHAEVKAKLAAEVAALKSPSKTIGKAVIEIGKAVIKIGKAVITNLTFKLK
jgi:hypothetical protein